MHDLLRSQLGPALKTAVFGPLSTGAAVLAAFEAAAAAAAQDGGGGEKLSPNPKIADDELSEQEAAAAAEVHGSRFEPASVRSFQTI